MTHAMTTEEHATEAVRLLRQDIKAGRIPPMEALAIVEFAHAAHKADRLTQTEGGIERCNSEQRVDGRAATT